MTSTIHLAATQISSTDPTINNKDKDYHHDASPSPTSTTTTDDDHHHPVEQQQEEEEEEGDYYLEFGLGGHDHQQLPTLISDANLQPMINMDNKIKTHNNWGIIQEEDHEGHHQEVAGLGSTARNYYHGQLQSHHNQIIIMNNTTTKDTVVTSNQEIIEDDEEEAFEYRSSSSFHHHQKDDESDAVYVVVSSSSSAASMDALEWTLENLKETSSAAATVFLVHVFPLIKHIPTPCKLVFFSTLGQQRDKRRDFLNKFVNACTTSAAKVNKVETILIESDMEAQAIVDLIPVLNITKLVLGTSKPNLRKMRSNKASGSIVEQIVKAAPESCEVNLICEGKQVPGDPLAPSPAAPTRTYHHTPHPSSSAHQPSPPSFKCGGCFKF